MDLARRHGLSHLTPTTDPAWLAQWYEFTGFAHFIRAIRTIQRLILTPDDFAIVIYQASADMAEQNIRYPEINLSPYKHIHLFLDKRLEIGDILDGLDEGRRSAEATFGVELWWVFDISRNLSLPARTVSTIPNRPTSPSGTRWPDRPRES